MSTNEEPDPVGWVSDVTIEGSETPVRVVFVSRDGSSLVVRQMDPCDPEPERVPMYEGDRLQVAQAFSHIGINTSAEVGDTSRFLFGMRIVEVRRAPGKVYARSLRRGEIDTGARVPVYRGETLQFEEGSIVTELDHIDDLQEPTESGYVPLTPVFSTWFSFGIHQDAKIRYLMAAARRLDAANLRLIEAEVARSALQVDGLAGPAIRRNVLMLIGAVQSAIIALGRVVDMVLRANELIAVTIAVPPEVTTHSMAIREIRNAYEHIEDRALGRVPSQPHPNALSIFDYKELLENDVVVYGSDRINLSTEVKSVVGAARALLKTAARDA